MTTILEDVVVQKLEEASGLYHRLVLLVGPAATGKTAALRAVSLRTGAPLVNLNLELSKRMLDLTERQRALAVANLVEDILAENAEDIVLLDNIEILFDVSLKLDPLRLLQGSARSRTLVAAWNGAVENNQLTYAEPGHPEYRKYLAKDCIIVPVQAQGKVLKGR